MKSSVVKLTLQKKKTFSFVRKKNYFTKEI